MNAPIITESLIGNRMRPGNGWCSMGGPVWEHASGVRVHWSAPIVRLQDGDMPPVYADRKRMNRIIRINGGNRKRGVMAYALILERERRERMLP